MADLKITQGLELTTLSDDDLVVIVDSPACGAAIKKITKANALARYDKSGVTDVPVTANGTGASTAAAARANLGLAIGPAGATQGHTDDDRYCAGAAIENPGGNA